MGTGSCSALLGVYRIETGGLESRHSAVGVMPGGQGQSVGKAPLEPHGGC